jgi:hypothetical protein
MSILVTCGHEDSEFALAGRALAAAGVAEALPFHDDKFTPGELVRKTYEAHRPRDESAKAFAQIDPSRLWQALAVDMVLANIDQEHWGWADSLSVSLLEFWRDFDPGFNFVLVYAPPEYALARLLMRGPADPRAVAAAIRTWQDYNEALLDFFTRNRDRALLVNAEALAANPADLIANCRSRFGIELKLTNEPVASELELPAAALWSAASLVENAAEARSLFEELESAADLPSAKAVGAASRGERALAEYRGLMGRIEEALLAHRALSDELDAERQENQLLAHQLRQAQEELTDLHARLRDAERDSERLNDELAAKTRALLEERNRALESAGPRNSGPSDSEELASLRAKMNASEKENELLLLQLQQVQEELEHYFLKYTEMQQQPANAPASRPAPPAASPAPAPVRGQTTIDMRHVIDGTNWHNAEHDGRWAGPGPTSSIRLPALPAGRYRLELEIVDAILPEIARATGVRVNGTPVKTRMHSLGRLDGAMAPLKHAYLTYYKRRPIYPLLVKGEFTIGDGAGDSPSRLELDFPRTVSPASTGGTDSRHLAIRLRQVRVLPL